MWLKYIRSHRDTRLLSIFGQENTGLTYAFLGKLARELLQLFLLLTDLKHCSKV